MLKDNNFLKYWALSFLSLKYVTTCNFVAQNNNNIKIRLKNYQNDLLGMPNSFLKLIFKPYVFEYKAVSSHKDNHSFYIKFMQLLFLFSYSSLNSSFKENSSCFEVNYNETLLFYSNFNVFSMSFLFKSNYDFVVQFNKLNPKYLKDYFVFSGVSLVSLKT